MRPNPWDNEDIFCVLAEEMREGTRAGDSWEERGSGLDRHGHFFKRRMGLTNGSRRQTSELHLQEW